MTRHSGQDWLKEFELQDVVFSYDENKDGKVSLEELEVLVSASSTPPARFGIQQMCVQSVRQEGAICCMSSSTNNIR